MEARARSTDPVTSHDAAASISSEKLRRSQQNVLTVLREHGPQTDGGIFGIYASSHWQGERFSPSGLRSRRAELVAKGLVRATGRTVILGSGRRSIVWEAVP